ncbi:MAG TPA: DUF5916 domain-containing protein [Thermoanaerobaculia bacterium]|nr:DUF5916 domain-containing protein [Thermoanaerobaculia bacterium]
MRPGPAVVACLLVLGLAEVRPAAAQHANPVASLEALPITEPIQVDGRLDEEVWSRTAVGGGFTQRERPDQSATERTEVMVAYTPTTLYIGLRCFDAHPDQIVAKEMEYDGRLFRDDSVIVVLDTFHDHRNAYFLETNPNGAILDALSSDEGRVLNNDWDGVWGAASKITSFGWTSEMAIPFATLRFDPRLDTWGFNVRRLVARTGEQSYWMQVGRDASLLRMSRAGHLTGLHGLEPALNLRIKPHVVGSRTEVLASGAHEDTEEPGLDVKWGITRGLALDLTYNTDFAEAEADDQQVNLTRFSLFFKEKREFFLENSGIFEVVPPSQLGGTPLLKLFHSRRIGIAPNGLPVPIRWGTRLTGRAGDWSIGLLDVATESLGQTASGIVGGIPADNWGIVRLKRNVGERSSVGMIFTNVDEAGGDSNQVYGVDTDLNPTPKLNMNAFVTGSKDPGVSDWAGGASAVYTGQELTWSMETMEIGDQFNPEAGFLSRSGIRRYAPTLVYKPRPQMKGFRNLQFDTLSEVITDLDNNLETFYTQVGLGGFVLDKEDQASFFMDVDRERLTEFFVILPGIGIPPGVYDFADFGLTYSTSPTRRNFYASGTVTQGQFYNGNRLSTLLTLGLRPSRNFRAETRWSRDDVDLPAGAFIANVWRQRLSVSFTPNLSTNAFIQYNDAADLLSLNLRFNWIYRPGADIFVVYNENWIAPDLRNLEGRERQLILKFTYLLAR